MNTLHTQANRIIEISFQSSIKYLQPFRDITLDVIFTNKLGEEIKLPTFWAGDAIWKVRFSSATLGIHAYKTICSDEKNRSLHAQQGQLQITAYLGDNPVYQHGALRCAHDKRHFEHLDGTPFFWLGDTWWMGLCKRLAWPEDFQSLANNRKKLGFNVIQLVSGLYPDMAPFDERSLSESGYCWDTELYAINPAFFDEADQRILYLVEQGLMPCILGAWGYYLPFMGIDNIKLHWRYIIARWGAYPVVWVAAGEQTMPWYLESPQNKTAIKIQQKNLWSEVLTYMQSLNGFKRLITTHPVTSARESVSNTGLLDFEMQQTNHFLPTKHHAQRAIEGWQTEPTMPVISAEARYEALEISSFVTTQNVREAFWAHTLNSGCAGHTYGANGIWQINESNKPFGLSASGINWGTLPWKKAMLLSGAAQLGVAKTFLMTLPWYQFQRLPLKNNLLLNFVESSSILKKVFMRLHYDVYTSTPVAACIAKEASIALFYCVTKKAFNINMQLFNRPVFAYWVDPTTGIKKAISTKPISQDSNYLATPPKKNRAGDKDWLLLICPKRDF